MENNADIKQWILRSGEWAMTKHRSRRPSPIGFFCLILLTGKKEHNYEKTKAPFFAKLNTLHPQLSFITEEILNKTGM